MIAGDRDRPSLTGIRRPPHANPSEADTTTTAQDRAERRLLNRPISMRRHHEGAATIVPALVMLLPVAGVLWARLISIRGTSPPPQTEKGDP
jgi:hypothetical protein